MLKEMFLKLPLILILEAEIGRFLLFFPKNVLIQLNQLTLCQIIFFQLNNENWLQKQSCYRIVIREWYHFKDIQELLSKKKSKVFSFRGINLQDFHVFPSEN